MYFRSLLFYLLYVSSALLVGIMICLFSLFLNTKQRLKLASWWPRFTTSCLKKICNIEVEVKGETNIPKGPFVLVSNHQSSWEAFFFQYYFFPVTTLLKRELLFIPIWGWALGLLGPIHINRKKPKKAVRKFMKEGHNRLKNGFIVLNFAEGTRKSPGEIGNYARSPFELSKQSGFLLLPVVHNAGSHWEAHRFVKKPGKISLVVGEAVKITNSLSQAKEVEDWSRKTLNEMAG